MKKRTLILETGRLDRIAAPKSGGYVGGKFEDAKFLMNDTKKNPVMVSKQTAASKATADAERRSSQRFTLVASAEVLDLRSGMCISARVADLSLSGCYMDCLSPLPVGSNLHLRISCNSQSVELKASVRFSHDGLGMGVGFDTLTPDQPETIGRWMGAIEASRIIPTELPPLDAPMIEKFMAPAASAELASSRPRKVFEELFTILVRKGILSESEMQHLLGKL